MAKFKKGHIPKNVSHGQTRGGKRTKLYTCWRNMMNRCYQPSSSRYKTYGARGIKVCERWHSFENFAGDMGNPPLGFSIDRLDINGPYSPENCQWLLNRLQTRKQTRSVNITYLGKTMCIAEWAELFKVKADLIRKRLKLGWTPEEIFSIKPRSYRDGGLRCG